MSKNVLEIISENIPFPEDFDMIKGKLEITVENGYINIFRQNKPEHGGTHTYYAYHPNEVCETSRGTSGPGICAYCGCTLFDGFNDTRE